MLYKIVPRLRGALIAGLLLSVVLFATACNDAATLTPYQTSPRSTATPLASLPSTAPRTDPSRLRSGQAGQRVRFDRISIEQGLSQNTIYCMLQDSKGFMWFGTQDGLNKYDGYTFTVYRHDPEDPNSLSGNWVWAIHEDRTGVLWIGTLSGGLDRYDRGLDQFTHYQNDASDPHSLSDNQVTSIYEDRADTLWIGTANGGLNKLDRETGRFTHYQHDPDDAHGLSSNAVSAIYEDREGVLWIGTDGGGLNRLDRERETVSHYQNDPGDPHSLSHNTVRAILEDREDNLWIGTDRGLDRLVLSKAEGSDHENGRFIRYQNDPDDPHSLSHNQVREIHEDRSGVLWIGTEGGGLDRLVLSDVEGSDPENEAFTHYQNDPGDPHSLSHWGVLDIDQDREGVLWIGTYGGGLNKLDVAGRRFVTYQNDPNDPYSLSDNDVRGIHQDRSGTLWVATNAGLNGFDRDTGRWRHYRHDPNDSGSLSSDIVLDVYQDRKGVLWVGTSGGGLDRLDPESERFIHYQADPSDPHSLSHNIVTQILEDREGVLWIGMFGGGLDRFDRETSRFTHYQADPNDPHSLSDNRVWLIYEDREGVLWIGTFEGGLDRFDRESNSFDHYRNDPGDPHSLSNNAVIAMYEDREGMLWIGTSGGLDKFDRVTETFTHYREKDGLPNDMVYGILEDEQGYLWVSTNRGLSRFDPRTETFKNYDATDGLQSNEFNSFAYHKNSSGEMFFGGVNGLNAFHPDDIRDNPTIPPLVLTALTQNGEPLDVGGATDSVTQIAFKWPDNSFEFEFAALSYAYPEKNQYAYKLEGVDDDWITTGTRRYGRYTNLPGGTYTLRLKGSNNDGIWNEAGAAVTITVVPPFWATWWFRGIVLLVLVGTAFGGYRLRVRRLEARGRELESQVNDRTKELAALNAVAAVVSRSLNLPEILSSALNKTLEVVGVEAGGIYVLQEDTQVLIIAAHEGLSAQFVAEIDNLKVGEGFSGRVVQTGEPLVVQDISTDPGLTRLVALENGFHALGIAPLLSRANVLGALFVVTRGRREFSPQGVELLAAIGAQIGVAVENARLYEQAQQVAVVAERQRLARELHDSVTQSLYSLTLFAEAARHVVEELGNESVERQIAQIGKIGVQTLKEMRLLVYELRPPELEQEGLIRALRKRLEAVEGRAGVEARVVADADGLAGLPGSVVGELHRIAQEALNNALKHAATTSVTVHLGVQDGRVELEVVDDGIGFDPRAVREHGGMGLESIRERAERMGGRATIQSTPGEGTSVKVTVPLGETG